MTMIAFITISSLVPFIEGLCSSDSISIRVLGFHVHIFCIAFSEPKILLKEKSSQSRSHPASQQIHTHVYFVHIYKYIYARFGPSGFFGSSRYLVPIPGLTSSDPRAVCVCVCIFTHIHTRTLPVPSRVKNRQDTRQPPTPSDKCSA